MKIVLNLLNVSSMMFCVLFLALTATEAALVHQHGIAIEGIAPALEPKSSKKFFGKDYPNDKRAVADKNYVFDHPYPAVQDSNDFDADYVKDENSDGGKWASQMEYDTLRSKIQAEYDKLNKLKKGMEKEYEEWLRAKKDAANYEDAVKKAQQEVDAARKLAEAAEKKVNELEGRSQAEGTKAGGAIGEAIGDVKTEMDDLEKCKEALAKAKAKLKEALKQRDEAKAQEAKAKEAKEKEAAEAKAKAAKEDQSSPKVAGSPAAGPASAPAAAPAGAPSPAAAAAKTAAEKAAKEEADKEEAFKKEVEKDTKKVSEARKDYAKEQVDVKRTAKQLEEAAKTLKKFRRPPYVDDDGGVYNVPSKSLATMARARVAFGVMSLALVFAALV